MELEVDNRNYIGALFTFCVRRDLPGPEFSKAKARSGAFFVTVTFSYNGTLFRYEGSNRRKRVAKQRAAEKLWTELNKILLEENEK